MSTVNVCAGKSNNDIANDNDKRLGLSAMADQPDYNTTK